jgi:transposase
LTTNLTHEDKYPASSILGEYKQQSRVEARFGFLKSPYLLGQILLQKQSHIEALGYVLLMALLIATLLERRVRRNLETEGTPIMIPGQKKTMRPMARIIVKMLDAVQVAYVEHEGEARRVWIDSRHGFDMPRLLRLAFLPPISTRILH